MYTNIFLKNMIIFYLAFLSTIIGFIADVFFKLNGIGILIGTMISMILMLFAIEKTKDNAKDFYKKK